MRGAYGLTLAGPAAEHPSLPEAPSDWPKWHLAWAPSAATAPRGATLPVVGGGFLDFLPAERTCVIATDSSPATAALAHPWLSTIGAWIANHRGFETFHAGGVVIDGALWVILGQKQAGKTTTLAVLHRLGFVVTSDDLIVVAGGLSLSGPACLDLRPAAAEALDMGTPMTLLPGRERWRVNLPSPPAEVPLAGFVVPAWSPGDVAVVSVPASERLHILFQSRSALWRDDRGVRMLHLASLPMLRWSRGRSFERLDENLAALVTALRRCGYR